MSASEEDNEKVLGRINSVAIPQDAVGGVDNSLPAPEEFGDAGDETTWTDDESTVRDADARSGAVLRDHKVLVGTGTVVAAAALGGAYVRWRRSGRRSRGPLSRLMAGRI
ncbi:hypothetical protein ACFU8I_10595 [Streptomyces sp. NPDC057540]|uniref:hypothetical protein n=1 Tax=Streptomyces sp. NPDC057540 TaxID=3346160 RepID=UPI00368D2BD0